MLTLTLESKPQPKGRAMHSRTEQETLARARTGDADAFRALVEKFTPRVFSVARNLVASGSDAEDVVQEVFFKVYSKLDSFREEAAFSTWLYRVTVNAAADYMKKRRRDKSSLVEDMGRLPLEDPDGGPIETASRSDLQREIRLAMQELPEKFRSILVLRELEGLAYTEISEVLGISKGTVESRLFRARARLKDRLERALKDL